MDENYQIPLATSSLPTSPVSIPPTSIVSSQSPSPQNATPPFTPPQKSHKRIFILALFLILILIAGVFLGWEYFFNKSKNEIGTLDSAIQGKDYASGEIIVKLKKGITKYNLPADLKTIFDKESITSIEQMYPEEKDGSLSQYYLLKLSPNVNLLPIIHKIQKNSNVQSAEPSFMGQLDFIPNDPYFHSKGSWQQSFDDLWALKLIQVDQAWDITQGNESLVVGVIDSGLDVNHPDISSKVINPKNILDDKYGSDVSDCNGHGTHVAGTIAAIGNNQGIIGVAPNVKIMPISIFAPCKEPDTKEPPKPNFFTKTLIWVFENTGVFHQVNKNISLPKYVKALNYAARQQLSVINISSGFDYRSQLLDDAMTQLVNSGSIIVVAAGNEGRQIPSEEGLTTNPKVIVVSAVDHTDTFAKYSNYGPRIDVSAPGGDTPKVSILSLKSSLTPVSDFYLNINGKDDIGKSGYMRKSGTSMAAPHVAGLAALLKSQHPDRNAEQIKCAIIAGADKPAGMKGKFHDDKYGYGRINAYKTLQISNPATNCRAQVVISSPDTNSGVLIGTKVSVQGLASSQSFNRFLLEYASSDDQNDWKIIRISSNPQVQDGLLGEWDTTTLKEGSYILRLTVKSSQDTDISATKELYLYKQNGKAGQTSGDESPETGHTSTETTTPSGSPVTSTSSKQPFILWFDKDQTDFTFSCNYTDYNCNLTSGKISGYAKSLKGKIKKLEYAILVTSPYLSPDYDNVQYKTIFDSIDDQNPASFAFDIAPISLGKALDGIAAIRFRLTDNEGNMEQVVAKTMSVGKNGIAIQLHKYTVPGRVEKNYPNSELICRDGSQNCDQKGINLFSFYCDEEQKRRCVKEIVINKSLEPLPAVSPSFSSTTSPVVSPTSSLSKSSSDLFTIWFDKDKTNLVQSAQKQRGWILLGGKVSGYLKASSIKVKKLEYAFLGNKNSDLNARSPYYVVFDSLQTENPVSFNFEINESQYTLDPWSVGKIVFRLTDENGKIYQSQEYGSLISSSTIYLFFGTDYEFRCDEIIDPSQIGSNCKKKW